MTGRKRGERKSRDGEGGCRGLQGWLAKEDGARMNMKEDGSEVRLGRDQHVG